MNVFDSVTQLVAPLVEDMGLSLYDIEQSGGTLRVSVQAADHDDRAADQKSEGIPIRQIQRLSRMISSVLDEEDPIPGKYTLEVTSPGLERKLRTPVHFAGATGGPINVKLVPGTDPRRVTGQLTHSDDDGISVIPDSVDGNRLNDGDHDPITFTYPEIHSARTIFVWGPTPKKQLHKKPKKQAKKQNQNKSGQQQAARSSQ
jgi:ribosome maturation factor RimP